MSLFVRMLSQGRNRTVFPGELAKFMGGPYHASGKLESYLQRLRKTERSHLAVRLAEKYPNEV